MRYVIILMALGVLALSPYLAGNSYATPSTVGQSPKQLTLDEAIQDINSEYNIDKIADEQTSLAQNTTPENSPPANESSPQQMSVNDFVNHDKFTATSTTEPITTPSEQPESQADKILKAKFEKGNTDITLDLEKVKTFTNEIMTFTNKISKVSGIDENTLGGSFKVEYDILNDLINMHKSPLSETTVSK